MLDEGEKEVRKKEGAEELERTLLATLQSWSKSKKKKKENRKPKACKGKRKRALRKSLFFLSLNPVNIIQKLFSPPLTPDKKKMMDKISSKESSCPWTQSVPSPLATQQAESPGPRQEGINTPKERSTLEAEPSGPCKRNSLLSAVLSRSLSPPCLLFPLFTILSQF